ncbi:response regulator [Pseudoxanthomonas gei]|uniref:Response regulator n=2 Tax=Pseudoxanthomonas gei TaxID=1383030 RepID=A0ABX0ABY9_9GAMM|nr:response regulator [Pseudoxanthomonas gei]
MSDHTGMKPRLLLVEDDPISCSFMAAALEAMPAEVETAASMASALAQEDRHDLWLLDVNLPDGSGIGLLETLRARCPGIPALAHTADDSPLLHARLRAAGFDGVLVKPLTAAQLQEAVRGQLGASPAPAMRVEEAGGTFGTLPLWDQATALAALNGSHEHVATLRKMFLDELGRQHDEIRLALHTGDPQVANKTLHQLKASSGFVGALRLNAAAAALEKSLADPAMFEHFSRCVRDTRA